MQNESTTQHDNDKQNEDEIAEIDRFFAGEHARKDELRYGKESMKFAKEGLAKIYASLQATTESKPMAITSKL
jgi:adenylate cyclase